MKNRATIPPLPWDRIETVFLDMDGTLLDLHFDNHFWMHFVPARYAEKHGLSLEGAREDLYPRFRAIEGTLDWYCIEYWSRELEMDIAALKRELEHLIQVRPQVREVLESLQQAGKRIALLTNAHHKVIELKMQTTGLDAHFEKLICSHSFSCPKEDPRFWPRLAEADPFSAETTLFVDDSLPVLRTAQTYGVQYLRAIHQPDSKSPPKDTGEFIAIKDFGELLAGLTSA